LQAALWVREWSKLALVVVDEQHKCVILLAAPACKQQWRSMHMWQAGC